MSQAEDWIVRNFGMIVGAACALVIGTLYLVMPQRMLRYTLKDQPGLADENWAVMIARIIGIGFFITGVLMIGRLR